MLCPYKGVFANMTTQNIRVMRRTLASAERTVRDRAESEARRLASMEREAWTEAHDRCLQLEKIRRQARARLAAIADGSPQRYPRERATAVIALREVARCEPRDSAAFTLLSFASARERLCFLRSGPAEREALLRATLARGGVFDDRGRFWEILR